MAGGTQGMMLSADTCKGNKVVNRQGEDLGEIKDLMIDTGQGQIAYAVMSFGGFLGMGDKLFSVPWKAFSLDTEHKQFILDVDKKRLENAPGFDKDNWPNMADPQFKSANDAYYRSLSQTPR